MQYILLVHFDMYFNPLLIWSHQFQYVIKYIFASLHMVSLRIFFKVCDLNKY